MGNATNCPGGAASARRSFWLAAFACLLATALWGLSAQACEIPDIHTDKRPDPNGTATEIDVAIAVVDVLGVDDVNQQLDLDVAIELRWNDPRLEGLSGCRFPVTAVWFPEIYILNSSSLVAKRTNRRDDVSIGENGAVTYFNRYAGSISTYHNLAQFPFDSHRFAIEFAVPDATAQQLVLRPDTDSTWLSSRLNVEGWTFHGVSLVSKPETLQEIGREISIATLNIDAERDPNYYIFRVLLLLGIVVAMSWIIFWVPPERFEFQIGLGATAMLTAIAFNFSVANSLPPVGYLTIMDRLVIWAVILIFLATAEALLTAQFVIKQRPEIALRIDRVARIAVPLSFALGWLLIIQSG